MATRLSLLLVEDSADDAALLLSALRRAGYDVAHERVQTAADLRAALEGGPWDVVVSDYAMPGFTGLDALAIVRASGLDLPFIMVSGTIGEETAVEAMRAGANDYVMKGRLARLVPAVKRELREAAGRQARRSAERGVQRRDAILKAVGAAAERLLRAADVDAAVPEVLAGLGEALEASRACILEITPADGELLAAWRHEWIAPGAPPEAATRRRTVPLRASGCGRWVEVLGSGRPLVGHAREAPAEERSLLEEQGIRSFACLPILAGEAWWGAIGFEDAEAEREWSAAEMDALKTAADTLAAAIQRHHVEEEVQRQVQRLAGLRAINVAMNASLDLRVTLSVLLEHAVSQLGVDAADVLLLRPEAQELEFASGRGFRSLWPEPSLRLGQSRARSVVLEGLGLSVPDVSNEPGCLGAGSLPVGEGFVAYHAFPLVAKGAVKGVLELFHRAPLQPSPAWLEFAQTLAGQAAAAIENALLFEDLQRSHRHLTLAYDTTLEGWSRAMDLRDRDTEGHTQRVTELVLRLARELGMTETELVHMRRGALLHDIGKMGIPDRILLKPGPLTRSEWDIMRLHPIYAYEWLAPIPYLREALDIPYCHHERWDGMGYPRGLRGEAIPLAARAFAVVDVWDALGSNRPYRQAWPEDRVGQHVRALAGTHFDPRVVEVFLDRVIVNGALPAVAVADEPAPLHSRKVATPLVPATSRIPLRTPASSAG